MTTFPNPTWADSSPAWVAQLRATLAERDAQEAAPAPEDDSARQMQLSAAHQWLGTRARDAGRAIGGLFSIAPELGIKTHQSGGTEIPQWTATVWGGPPDKRARFFTYTLTLDADSESVIPRVTVRIGDAAPKSEPFLPWATKSGGRLDNLTADDIAGDFALRFSEAMAT